ncbi:VanZ family protein [Rummeliibacillus stabekisii]|uniref:VanZ-like domain-containing protein n=1 Tax=Rummeliibacillus stabekisii TaxID=241244 RepID=A0A143HET7_9BACL|nr:MULTISPECIES: VanZ family protein [Rummeliibacillus]AMX00249.1 hypothetical protein ATY39_13020 [Rummeliibacillus stabekisii]MCM3317831.1 VanZ family protein [Rummeliibacillus stabekisii]
MKKYIPLLILILAIFISSSQSYEQQTIVPTLQAYFPNEPFRDLLSKLHFYYYGMDISVDTRGYYYFLEFLCRKAAHFFTFGAIGIAVYIALPRRKYRFVLAVLAACLLAVIDEFHQYFTSGRTASYQDVLLDTSGAIVLLLIWNGISILVKRRAKKKAH